MEKYRFFFRRILIVKLFLLCAFFFNFNYLVSAQTSNPKIKVILLGTFHYGATSDRNSTAFKDLFSTKRQSELDTIAQRLIKAGVNKFFLERAANKQNGLIKQFEDYSTGKMSDTILLRNEIIQIAYRTAKLNNAKLIATDNPQELPYDKLEKYDKKHKDDTVNVYSFFNVKYPFDLKQKKLKESTLSDYYIQLNNSYNRQALLYDYLHYALAYGVGDEFIGEELTLSWYDRNLKIFTNILRNVDIKTDKTVVVLYGASHTILLRHFFENHPYFEIVELGNILK